MWTVARIGSLASKGKSLAETSSVRTARSRLVCSSRLGSSLNGDRLRNLNHFPDLRPGDRWCCVRAVGWSTHGGPSAPRGLAATHESALGRCLLPDVKVSWWSSPDPDAGTGR